MKKAVLLTALLLSNSCFLCGCFPNTIFIPNENSLGQTKRFEKNGFSILLTDKITEEQSQMGLMHTLWQIFAEWSL